MLNTSTSLKAREMPCSFKAYTPYLAKPCLVNNQLTNNVDFCQYEPNIAYLIKGKMCAHILVHVVVVVVVVVIISV
jgi:hypothetical protein